MGGGGICEKRNTHTRQNLTIQQGNMTGHCSSSPVPRDKRMASPYPLWERTNSQPLSPFSTRGAWFKGAGPSHLLQGNRRRPGWKQGPEGAESGWGSAKSTGWRVRGGHPRNRGPGKGPFHPGIPRALRRPCRAEFQVPAPPHSLLLTSRSLSLRLHHNPSRPSRHCPNHFSAQPPQPRPKASADCAASRAQSVTSGQGSTAFHARLLPDWLVQTSYLR